MGLLATLTHWPVEVWWRCWGLTHLSLCALMCMVDSILKREPKSSSTSFTTVSLSGGILRWFLPVSHLLLFHFCARGIHCINHMLLLNEVDTLKSTQDIRTVMNLNICVYALLVIHPYTNFRHEINLEMRAQVSVGCVWGHVGKEQAVQGRLRVPCA